MVEPMIERVKLGATDLSVSNICFGASGLGDMPDTYGYDVSEARAKATVAAILDSAINFIDTSRIYGFGRSEDRIGAVIRQRGGLPKGFVLSTKLDRDPNTGRFDASQARRSLEQSLAALGVDKIDLLHLHDPEHGASLGEITGPNGAIAELFKIKEEGLAKAVGLAAGSVSVMMPMLRDFDFDALITHNRFTLANRNAEAMIDFAHARGIAVLNAAPYAGGVLAKGSSAYTRYVYQEASPELLEPIRRIEAICGRHNVPPGAVALQFSMRDRRIASTICGVSKPERVSETLEWARFPVPDIVWEELKAVGYSVDDPEASRNYRPG
jgi:D-threo-aldose 1-dehydrogenase